MEKQSAKPNRSASRMEKVKGAVERNAGVTALGKLKQALKTKTFWLVVGSLTTLATIKQVLKPWYEQYKAKQAEEYANFLWEKSKKKSIEQ